MTGAIAKITLRLNITHTFDSDLILSLFSPTGTEIPLIYRQGHNGHHFTDTVLDDAASTAITSGTAPFTGRFRPQRPLSEVAGLSANGSWTLQIKDISPNNNGTLNGWSIVFATVGEPSTQTDANGNYTFTSVPPGTYCVRQVLPDGWTQTTPNPEPIAVPTSGASVAGGIFGNLPRARLRGRRLRHLQSLLPQVS